MRGYTLGKIYSRDSVSHCVTLWEQPTHRWLIATVYHRYDMLAYRIPGFRQLERWLERRHRGNDDIIYVPLSCRQDIRCDELTEKSRRVLATLAVDSETYERCRTTRRKPT